MDSAQRLSRLQEALTLLEGGQNRQVERICRQLLNRDRGDIEALLFLGLAVGARGEADAAAPILNRVARARGLNAHPCSDLARMLSAQDKAPLVEPQYRACLALTPDDARLRYGLAGFLREHGYGEAAVAVLEPLLAAHPDSAEAHDQTGMALAEAGRFAEAAEHFRAAIARDPAQAVFWANLGMMLKIDGQFDAALDAYDEALARAPGDRQIRVNRAVTRLQAGRFAEAWQDEDWILAEPGRSVLPADRLLPPLSRLPDLTGRTVLVLQEEGLGDTLQFLRYLPLLARRGARVVAVVPPALTRLMRTVPGVAEVPDGDAPVPRFDFHCSFNGLPRAFETTLETIPCDGAVSRRRSGAGSPVARAAAGGRCAARRAVLGRAGAAVAGGVRRARSPAQHRPGDLGAARRRVRVCGSSVCRRDRRQRDVAGFDLLDVMDEVRDFADTAAIVANLDLVISVDTSVLHLAGAMGKPVFLLDRYDNCWRWLSGREDSPWYPSLRIFRQQQQRRLGAGDRARRYGACCSGRPSIPGAAMPRCRMMLGARSVT